MIGIRKDCVWSGPQRARGKSHVHFNTVPKWHSTRAARHRAAADDLAVVVVVFVLASSCRFTMSAAGCAELLAGWLAVCSALFQTTTTTASERQQSRLFVVVCVCADLHSRAGWCVQQLFANLVILGG